MNWGYKNRMAKILPGKAVMLAVDHGYFLGPISGLEKPWNTVKDLLPYADSLALTRGVLTACIPPEIQTPIILRVSGGTSVLNEDLSNETLITSMRDAVYHNVAAVAMSIFVGAPHEHTSLNNLGKLIDDAHNYHIPVLAITAVGKELDKRSSRYLALACRIAAEYGADVVKTYYCDDFEKVTASCPVPVVIAGGPKFATVREALDITCKAIASGAVGVDMGRNIWQADHPVAVIKAVRAIVHEGLTTDQALKLYEDYIIR